MRWRARPRSSATPSTAALRLTPTAAARSSWCWTASFRTSTATTPRALMSVAHRPAATLPARSPVARSSSSCGSSTPMTGRQCASTPRAFLSRLLPTSPGLNCTVVRGRLGTCSPGTVGARYQHVGASSRGDRIACSGRQLYRGRRGVHPALVAQTAGRCNAASDWGSGRLQALGQVRPPRVWGTLASCALTCSAAARAAAQSYEFGCGTTRA